jgi:signal transduction histidine kinase
MSKASTTAATPLADGRSASQNGKSGVGRDTSPETTVRLPTFDPAQQTHPPARAAEIVRRYDEDRRHQLLRVMLPGIFILATLAIPSAIITDLQSHSYQSTIQILTAEIPLAFGTWALWRKRINLAFAGLFIGLAAVIVTLILTDGPLQGHIDLAAIPVFSMLVLLIVIAALFGTPLQVALTTVGCLALTLAVILFTPHGPMLEQALNASDGLSLFTIPLGLLAGLGLLMFAANRGFSRTQRELANVRVAYEREKELDRLKNQFISSVNHELRTPIMALQGYLALARELGARSDYERQHHMLMRGAEAADQLADLVRSVLNVRNIEVDAASITPGVFALRPLIVDATSLLSPREAGEEPRELHLRVPEDMRVLADEGKTRQIILNLLSNAVKYSPSGSPIEIDAGIVAATAARRDAAGKPMVEVRVRDHGLGIPPEQIGLIFERFVRLERDVASNVVGTGLGLAICQAYIKAMGGAIWATSAGVEGEGTTMHFTLPLAPDPAEDA